MKSLVDFVSLLDLVSHVRGSTFASLDTETFPKPGLRKVCTGEQVILFATKGRSGYEAMVKRRLVSCGYNPDSFNVQNLPWGKRVGHSPIIEHKGTLYLQTVLLTEGLVSYYLGPVVCTNPGAFGIRERRPENQGLPADKAVIVRCYKLESIMRLAIFGEVWLREDYL